MAWSGGTYRKGNYSTNGWTGDASLGIGIEAGRHDTADDDFMNGINQCLNKDGSNAATGNLNIGSNRLTNVSAGTARTDAINLSQVQDNSLLWGGTSGGAANAQTLTLAPTITAYAAGQRYSFIAGFTNTAAATLNINGVGTKSIFNVATGAAIGAGEIVATRAYEVIYDGTQFLLLNDVTPIQNGDYIWLGTTGGTANVQTASASPAITSYKIGQKFRMIAGFASTSAVTLNINSLGPKAVIDAKTNAPLNGVMAFNSNDLIELVYNGTSFLWVSQNTLARFSADSAPNILFFYKSRGTSVGTNSLVSNGDQLGQVQFLGGANTDYVAAASIQALVDDTPSAGSSDMPGRLVFLTTANGSGSLSERMVIKNYGYVGINTSAPNGYLSVQYDGSADDFAAGRNITGANYVVSKSIYDKTTVSGANIAVESTGGSYPVRRSTSSIKYKKDIVDLDPAFADKLHQFRPVFFKSKCFGDHPEWTHYGFIAEELAEIESRFVSFGYQSDDYEDYEFVDADGKTQTAQRLKANAQPEPEGVYYDRIVTFLTSVVQRQQKKLEALEARIAALEA